jgi:hypothetical protein
MQKRGAWEAATDEKSKAMGMAGFCNINQKPECLKCGKA